MDDDGKFLIAVAVLIVVLFIVAFTLRAIQG